MSSAGDGSEMMKILSLVLALSLPMLPLALHAQEAPESTGAAQVAVSTDALKPLLALMDARLQLAPDVARYKWNTGGAIEDREREGRIIAALGQQAAELGLPLEWAERFFRGQIEASKALQSQLFRQWQQQGAGRFEQVPDLAQETRPKLDRLTPQLLQALQAAWPQLCQPAPDAALAARIRQYWAGSTHGEAAVAMASAPLLADCR